MLTKYIYDTRSMFAFDTSTGEATHIFSDSFKLPLGELLYKIPQHLIETELRSLAEKNRAIPTALLLAVIKTYPVWTLFDVSLQLNGCKASHTLAWNGKFSLRDMSQVDGTTRMVTMKKFYPGEGFWVINDITTQEDMNA
jgi:hypothetical protein